MSSYNTQQDNSQQDNTAQRWAKIAINAGFAIVIATWLVYFGTSKLDGKLDTMEASHQVLRTEVERIKTQNQTLIDQMWLLISVAQSTCINVATSPQERASCVQFTRKANP